MSLTPADDDVVGDQAEAYLQGRYRQYLEARHEVVPSWAWVNQVAHGTRCDLAGRASGSGDVGPGRLVASVALQLTSLSDAQLLRVQHERLMPLEGAMRDDDGDPPRSEEELARAIIVGLRSLSPGPLRGLGEGC